MTMNQSNLNLNPPNNALFHCPNCRHEFLEPMISEWTVGCPKCACTMFNYRRSQFESEWLFRFAYFRMWRCALQMRPFLNRVRLMRSFVYVTFLWPILAEHYEDWKTRGNDHE